MRKSYTAINPSTLCEDAGGAKTGEEPEFMLTQRTSSARFRPHIRRGDKEENNKQEVPRLQATLLYWGGVNKLMLLVCCSWESPSQSCVTAAKPVACIHPESLKFKSETHSFKEPKVM